MSSYPKWLYSVDGAVLVQTHEEHAALVGTWRESPADVQAEEVPADVPEEAPKRRGRPPKVSE